MASDVYIIWYNHCIVIHGSLKSIYYYNVFHFFHTAMHQLFQKDLFSLRLNTARSYVRNLATSMAPITTSQGASYKISAQVISKN